MKITRVLFLGVLVLIATASAFAAGVRSSSAPEVVSVEWLWTLPDVGNQYSGVVELAQTVDVDLTLSFVPHADQNQLHAVRIAGGQIPDMFISGTYNTYKSLKESGVLTNISEAIEKDGLGNIAAYLGRHERANIQTYADNGDFYRLPLRVGPSWDHGIYYRADWAEALGLGVPETADELVDFARAMSRANLDNHADAPYAISGIAYWAYGHMATAFTGHTIPGWRNPHFVEEDGQFKIAQMLDGYKGFLTYTRNLIREGLLDVEIMAHSQDVGIQKFASGNAAVWFGNIPDVAARDLVATNPNAVVRAIVPFVDAGYGRFGMGGTGYYQYLMVAQNSEARAAGALRVIDAFMSQKAYDELWGVKKWYTDNPDELSRHSALWPFGWGDQRDWEEFKQMTPVGYEVVHYLEVENPSAMVGLNYRSEEYGTDLSRRLSPEVASVILEYRAKFFLGELDIDANWNQYIAEMNKAGAQELIADITAFWE